MLVFSLFAALSTAQTAPAAEPQQFQGDIVVEGVRQRRERVRQFIRSLDDVPSLGQIGKFHSPVCPAVMGLPAAQGRLVADRMSRVAKAAGIRTGDAGCAPNVFLIAAVDKGSAIEALHKRFPAYFSNMARKEVRKLAASAEPAVAWQVKGLLSADGTALKKAGGARYYINEGTDSGWRIRAGTMPHFVASIVVVELGSLAGLTTTQVADYAAMRAFADTSPRGAAGSGAPTILTIFDKGHDQPLLVTLTHWDLGYLKSLYATSNAYLASYQRGAMEQMLEQELSKSGQSGK